MLKRTIHGLPLHMISDNFRKKNCDHNSVRSKRLGYIDEKFDSYRKIYEFNCIPHNKNQIIKLYEI